ncbi:SRPBCC family protein [Actinomycetospora sp. TBRC 11914]|uniref:SRPBCC family protein n=1 Tax=Actinomycetospora sp. TBRC 11914 TaxID=2729387 RepID=UPI00145D916B|nr:SRPBCC family protein [Actinomycetospora sp. TBRC 11914]NMO92517.1 hypothetical protein [Actinomycetospora sp. TBRC 11914]
MHHHREVRVGACPDYVWAVLTDVARWPEWAPALQEVVPFDGAPHVAGGGVRVRARRLPPSQWRVGEVRPHRGFTWTATGLGSASRLVVGIAPSPPGGSVVELTLERTGWAAALVGLATGTTAASHLDGLADGLRRRCAPRGVTERTR